MDLTEKQIHIIEVAEKLFAEQGYDGTSIRDISKAAGVNLAMVSYYFGSKEKLLEAIFQYRIFHSWFAVKESLERTDMNPLEKMLVLVDSFVEKLADKAHFHAIVVRQQLLGEKSPMLEMLHESKRRNHELISHLVKQGQEQGLFKPDADVAMIMITMVGTGYQFIHSARFYGLVSQLDNQQDGALNPLLLEKLRTHIHVIVKSLLLK